MNEAYFSPDWAELNLPPQMLEAYKPKRKDLNTLLKELEDIKENIQEIAAKQWRLDNLMRFHNGSFAK